MLHSTLLFLTLVAPAQAPDAGAKPPPPVPLYHPKKGDTVTLAVQPALPGVDAPALPASAPDAETYDRMLELLGQDPSKSGPELDALARAGKFGFLGRGTKAVVLKAHSDRMKNGVYPVEIEVLSGPARAAVLWTPVFNLSRVTATDSRKDALAKEAERRKAAREKKARAYAANRARERAEAQQAVQTEVMLAPLRAQAQTEMLRQQAAVADAQAAALRTRALQQLNALIRQDRINQAMRNGGVLFGPNGAILPGDPLP